MAAVALLTILTGASEEAGGIIVHVELAQVENPPPAGHDSWEGVIPDSITGPRYYWAPSGWVMVERTDGSVVRAWNEFANATYLSRVTLLKSRTGRWFITAVEQEGEEYEPYVPTEEGPRKPVDLSTKESRRRAAQEEVGTTEEATVTPIGEPTYTTITGDGNIAQPSETWGYNPGYEMLMED